MIGRTLTPMSQNARCEHFAINRLGATLKPQFFLGLRMLNGQTIPNLLVYARKISNNYKYYYFNEM